MFKFIVNSKTFNKIEYFKKNERRIFIPTFFNVLSFLIELIIISFLFKYFEYLSNGVHYNLSFIDSIYFIMTTAATVGYGDISPSTDLSKMFIITFVYLYLSYRLGSLISQIVDARNHKHKLKEIGRFFMEQKKHVIIYCDAETIKFDNYLWFKRFVQEHFLSNRFKNCPILLLNHNENYNSQLNEAMISNNNFHHLVSHLNINLDEEDFFIKTSINEAEHIYILGNSFDSHSDSKVFDFSYRIKEETTYSNQITAEITNDTNKSRLKNACGVSVVMRSNRSYPEMLISATIAPGSEIFFEELTSRGGDSFEVFNLNSHSEFLFGDALYKLSMNNVGTIVGVVYENGFVDANLMGTDTVSEAKSLIVMIYDMKNKSYSNVEKEINSLLFY